MKFFIFSSVFALMLFSVTPAYAAVYESIVSIPGVTNLEQMDTGKYINALYRLSITVAALMAVVKIIFGGAKWMLSDVVTDKASAKKDIKGALLGLLIVLSAVLILNTINTDLTKINFLGNAPPLDPINSVGSPELLEVITNDPNDERYGLKPIIMTCGTSSTKSCVEVNDECMATSGYVTSQQTDPNKLTCFTK